MNLKKLRQEQNLKQEDVAKMIQKSSVAYGYYESGRNEPDLKTLITLADFYNVSLDYLCDRPFNNGIGYINDRQRQLFNAIKELDEWQLERLEGYIAALKTAKEDVQKEISKRG